MIKDVELVKQILDDIEKEIISMKAVWDSLEKPPYNDFEQSLWAAGMRNAKEIIRKHMNDDNWIPCSERLPNKEEYLKDDGRFILDDGNRRYQGLFDIYDGKFKFPKYISGINCELFEDKCVIAWQPLPEPWRGKEK